MEIAVCFKLIQDYDHVPKNSFRANSFIPQKSGLYDTRYVKKIFGFFDEGALETALRAKDQDENIKLEAISLGKEDRIFTEALYASGYDTVTYLQGCSDFDSEKTALTLSSYIKTKSFDLILTGEAVGPMDTGCVPYLMANILDYPLINNISEIGTEKDKVILERDTKDTKESYTLSGKDQSLPCIAVISNAKHPYLRFASYERKEQAKKVPAKILNVSKSNKLLKFSLPEIKEKNIKYINKEQLANLISSKNRGDKP